jgi:ribosomal 50S subunit-recycling heat shock protein
MNTTRNRRPGRKIVNNNKKEDMTQIDEDNTNSREIILNHQDYLQVKTSKVVTINDVLQVTYNDGPVKLRVNITADFNEVPEMYHEIFLNVMTSRYLGAASFGDNPFSDCRPMKKRKWYEVWKDKYHI